MAQHMITEIVTNVIAAVITYITGVSPIIALLACFIQIHFRKAVYRFSLGN
jgi:hypothetical protein